MFLTGCNSYQISRDPNSTKLQAVDLSTMSIGDSTIYQKALKTSNSNISSYGIAGRKVVHRNHKQMARIIAEGKGKIFIITCINRAGDPEYLQINQDHTSIQSQKIQSLALEMISEYKFESDSSAADYQCGVVKLFIDSDTNRF